jgi:methylenetetrahydrofolate reductase (NADPH)
MTTLAPPELPLIDGCPKSMRIGPCGGVSVDGACEIDLDHRCVFLGGLPEVGAVVPDRADRTGSRADGRFERILRAGRFAYVAEVNGADSADATEFVAAARRLDGLADVVSMTDHSGANVHMGNVASTAHLLAAGVEAMPTFACRDRNRIALQGDLLGVASLGARNALLVTGNHVRVGDSPDARPVFDLDSTRLIAVAAGLREGRYDNGRPVEHPPALFLGGAAHPFAPPYAHRPGHVLRKVRAGADFLITQHLFDLPRWRAFLAGVNAERADAPPFFLLAGIAILPDESTARRVNAGLRGFSIPEATLLRLRRSADPQREGVMIAAETLAELHDSEGVAGALLAPVTGRQNALTASQEQADIIERVFEAAGVPPRRTDREEADGALAESSVRPEHEGEVRR